MGRERAGRERLRGLVELTRPVNAVAASVLTAVGAYVALGAVDGSIPRVPVAAVQAMAATVLATAGGNALNDYFDREIDRENRPDRPLPRGAVSPRVALAFASFLLALAVTFVVTLPLAALAIAGANLVLLATYTQWFKGLPGVGNAVVAWLVGSAFLFGAAAVSQPFAGAVIAALAAGATFAREVVKDIEDLPGDRAAGLRTLPIAVGERRALIVAGVVLGGAVLASPLPFVRGTLGVSYLVVVGVAATLMGAGMVAAPRDPARGQRLLKVGMFTAVIAFVVGRLLG